MEVIEIKQELNNTSFEQEIFDISKLSRHIVSMLDIAEEINYNDYKYVSSLTHKILKMLDTIDFILGKEMLEDVKYKTKFKDLSKYDFKHKRYIVNIRGYCNNTLDSFEQLKQDKIEFIRNGSLEKI